jgi:hypothetical protein
MRRFTINSGTDSFWQEKKKVSQHDVAVVGAGPAGVMAAAAVRRVKSSASVLLIEGSSRFGGSVTAAMHRSMCGLYSQAPRNVLDTLNDSAQRKFIEKMVAKDPKTVVPRQLGKAWVLEFPASTWEASLSEICSEAKIDLRMDSRVISVRREGARLTAIQVQDQKKDPALSWINVRAVIDCTGGGNILRLAGDDAFQPPDESTGRILGGFAIRLAGLTGDPEILRLQTAYALAQEVKKGLLPPVARFTTLYPGPDRGEGVCKLAINPQEMATSEAESFANQVIAHLKRETAGFAGARIVEFSPRVLPRDGLRLRGQYIVTEADVLQARKQGTDSVHAWWPIERWDISEGPMYAYAPVGEHYDVPSEAMRSAAINNLFAAGTCLSATSGAAASVRASGICLATGDAAGRLSAASLDE